MLADCHGVSTATLVISSYHRAVIECGRGKSCAQCQFSQASANQLQHTTAGAWGAFRLWCVYRDGPGLSPFSRVDGNHTMFLERGYGEGYERERVSL